MVQQDGSSERNGIRNGSGLSQNPIGNGSESVTQSAASVSVDSILANELNKLTFRERESINEEIHGIDVHNIEELGSTEETTEILNKSFHDLDREIKKLCSTEGDVGEMAYAFNRSQQLFGPASQNMTYLNRNEIRIMFIRCERFDCKKAAVRICKYADLMYDLYGDVGLERSIELSDLDDDEVVKLKQGCCQLLQGRDRAGRRIYIHYFSSTWKFLSVKSRMRIASYVVMAMVVNDVVSQRRGIVGVMWIGTEIEITVKDFVTRGKAQSRSSSCLPVRIGATHFCFPPMKNDKNEAIVHMITGVASQLKPHVRIHSGSPVELFYTLVSFGIASNQIPILIGTYELDLTNHNRWLDLCVAKEKDAELQKWIIECPNNIDILFGRGQIVMNHPGNIMFRNFIQSNLEAYSNIGSKKETTQFTLAAVRTLKTEYGARFLKEERIDSTITTWLEVSDGLARSKLRISFRDAKSQLAKRKEKETTTNNNEPLPLISSPLLSKWGNGKISTLDDNLSSSSPLFKGKTDNLAIPDDFLSLSKPQQQQQERLKTEMMQEFSNNIASLNGNCRELNSNFKAFLNQQISDSGTDAFLGLDGSSNTKRQRLSSYGCFDCL